MPAGGGGVAPEGLGGLRRIGVGEGLTEGSVGGRIGVGGGVAKERRIKGLGLCLGRAWVARKQFRKQRIGRALNLRVEWLTASSYPADGKFNI
jgi:hypothetical protein